MSWGERELQRSHANDKVVEQEVTLRRRSELVRSLMQMEELVEGDLDGMLRRVCDVACAELGVERVGVWLADEGWHSIRCQVAREGGADHPQAGAVLRREEAPGYFAFVADGRVVDLPDVSADPRWVELDAYRERNQVQSLLDVPIFVRGQSVGVLCHEGESVRHYNADEVWFASALADLASVAVQASERVRLERRREASERLERMGVLAGGVAHDFSNLLTVVLGNAELLEQQLDGVVEEVEAILTAGHRAQQVARQMLAYSGRATFVKRAVDLNPLAASIALGWSRELLGPMQVEVDKVSDGPVVALADATQLQQVLLNLLTNARDAGATQVRIRLGREAMTQADFVGALEVLEPGLYAWIEVVDDGRGMDPETIARVFDPFFTTRSAGTGMGLATVLGILRAHRGTVRVQSTPGAGTALRCWGPASNGAPDSSLIPAEAHSPVSVSSALIVEDEPDLLRLFARLFRRTGTHVHCFGSVVELWEAPPRSTGHRARRARRDAAGRRRRAGDGKAAAGTVRSPGGAHQRLRRSRGARSGRPSRHRRLPRQALLGGGAG